LSLNVCNIGLQCNLRFLSTTVLQGSVATRVNYGKIFNEFCIANLLLSVIVKEFWRSVRIRQSYGKKSSGTFFFRTRCSFYRSASMQGSLPRGKCLSLCLSVRPSVRLSVKRVNCDKTKETCAHNLIRHERTFLLVFQYEE